MKSLFLIIFVFTCSLLYSSEPYVISSGPISSYYIEVAVPIVKQIYKSIGMDIDIEFTSFERSIIKSSRGETDGEIFRILGLTEKYPDLLPVMEPLINIDIVAFSLTPHPNIKTWSDLKDYKLTYIKGIKIIETNTRGLNVITSNTLENAFNLLKFKRVDFFISGYYNGLKFAELDGIKDIQYTEPFGAIQFYHYVHRDNADLIPKLEQAIKELKK